MFNDDSDKNIVRTIIGHAIDNALSKMGPKESELVVAKLEGDDHSYMFDSLDHPGHIKKTLLALYVHDYFAIVDSIEKELGKFACQKPYYEFIKTMRKPLIEEMI